MTNGQEFQKRIGIQFRDSSRLEQAFVHSSFINENPDSGMEDNERLEFLGDALLSFIVAEKLYQVFPNLPEGKLTEMRISLIRRETLAEAAVELGIGDCLRLGKGEEQSGGRKKPNNLADAFEALTAAIYLDQGINATRDFVLKNFDAYLLELKTSGISSNYKALLQEIIQAEYRQLPSYHVVEASGPDHAKQFTVEVKLGSDVLGRGSGSSKRAAEMKAAHQAWHRVTAK